jgi:hypothetical protein
VREPLISARPDILAHIDTACAIVAVIVLVFLPNRP